MRIIKLMIILGGLLPACGTQALTPGTAESPVETVDSRLDTVEKSVDDLRSDIGLVVGYVGKLDKRLDRLDDLLNTLLPLPRLSEMIGPEGPPGPTGEPGEPGTECVDGEAGSDGLDGWPRSKAEMVVLAGASAKVDGTARVESYCPSPRDIAISGSCTFVSLLEDCEGVALKTWGTFDNDTASVAGFACTFEAAEKTACEVVAVADCLQLP